MPAAEHLANVFPQFRCSAIRESAGKAHVTMMFPNLSGRSIDCVMKLYISCDKVQHLIMGLFDMRLETQGALRYVMLPRGSRLRPYNITLHGVPDTATEEFLGSQIHNAISKSSMRKEEVRRDIYRTECVFLRLMDSADDDVLLTTL